jgi:hypothetical protein
MSLADQAAATVVSFWDDPAGRASTILAGIGAVLGGLVYVIKKVREGVRWIIALSTDLRIVKHEVKNDHKVNLRVEQDRRHDENTDTLGEIRADVKAIITTLGEHGYRIGELEDEVENTRDRRPDAH